jgi:hypothetical protein
MPSPARIVVALTIAAALALTSQAAGAEDGRGGSPQAPTCGAHPGRHARHQGRRRHLGDRAGRGGPGRRRRPRQAAGGPGAPGPDPGVKAHATEALIEVQRRTGELQQTLDARVRNAYMTGNLTGLALVLQADSLPPPAQQDRHRRLRRPTGTRDAGPAAGGPGPDRLPARHPDPERTRAAGRRAGRCRQADQAAQGPGATPQARAGSQELRRLILQQEQTLALAGGGGPAGGGPAAAATCRASHRPSCGSSCASGAGTQRPTTRPRPPSASASYCSATGSSTSARTMPPPTAASSCGRSAPTYATATAPPSGPWRGPRLEGCQAPATAVRVPVMPAWRWPGMLQYTW